MDTGWEGSGNYEKLAWSEGHRGHLTDKMICVKIGDLVINCKWKGRERIVSRFPVDEQKRSIRTWERTVMDELRAGFVAFEINVKVWSEEKSEMLVPEDKGVDSTGGEHTEEDQRTKDRTLR